MRLARLITAGQTAANPQALGAARLEVVQELLNGLLPHATTAAAAAAKD
ncbi:hypothetical protein OHB56_04725 [Streptomyces sp. NBC_01635]|nr:hypothetical protein OHB56_04725 [Streptomyces sp. NBC_01635]